MPFGVILVIFLVYTIIMRSAGLRKGMEQMRKRVEEAAQQATQSKPSPAKDANATKPQGKYAQQPELSHAYASHTAPVSAFSDARPDESLADYRPFEDMENWHWDDTPGAEPKKVRTKSRHAYESAPAAKDEPMRPVPHINANAMVQAVVLSEVLGKPKGFTKAR